MGGHGGLNILPQKSWHVYNQDNKQKVLRDEAKHAEAEEAARQKNEKAEKDFRRQLLLSRARQRSGVQELSANVETLPTAASKNVILATPSSATPAQAPPQHSTDRLANAEAQAAANDDQSLSACHSTSSAMQLQQQTQPPPLQHINFFREEEVRAKHDEEEAERRAAKARRGNPETQTSDARFDERFQFAHNLHGKAAQPWYTRRASALALAQQGSSLCLLQGLSERPSAAASRGTHGVCDGKDQAQGPEAHQYTDCRERSTLNRKSKRKEKKRKKRREKKAGKRHAEDEDIGQSISGESSTSNSERDSKDRHSKRKRKHKLQVHNHQHLQRKSVEQLRQERLAREQQERQRQQQVVETSLAAAGVPLGGKKYHSAFGNAAQPIATAMWHSRKQ